MNTTDPSVRIAAASAILLGGIVVAMLFRREAPPVGPPPSNAGDELVVRKHAALPDGEPGGPELRSTRPHAVTSPPTVPETHETAAAAPPDGVVPPPALAKDYPGGSGRGAPPSPQGALPWGTGARFSPPAAGKAEASATRHKIVDGDSLPALAERYLGSADRYLEIYEANAEVLPSPQVLPIGAELNIPPRQQQRPAPAGEATGIRRRPLVPVPRHEIQDD